jgi:hypothetical protein
LRERAAMSALGQKATSRRGQVMPALTPNAEGRFAMFAAIRHASSDMSGSRMRLTPARPSTLGSDSVVPLPLKCVLQIVHLSYQSDTRPSVGVRGIKI